MLLHGAPDQKGKQLFHAFLILFDHFFDHLATNRASFAAGKVSVIAIL
jgi:hypothetical protein